MLPVKVLKSLYLFPIMLFPRWEVNWEDEGRQEWHHRKMTSKLDRLGLCTLCCVWVLCSVLKPTINRAEKQMAALGLKGGLVLHEDKT